MEHFDDLDEFLHHFRERAEQQEPPSAGERISKAWEKLFIVRLWRAGTKRVIRSIESSDPLSVVSADGEELDRDARIAHNRLTKANQTMRLRRTIAKWAIVFVFVQLICSNTFFFLFIKRNEYDVDPPIMIAWLSACVVEVIAILAIIARSLFPKKDKNGKEGSSSFSPTRP